MNSLIQILKTLRFCRRPEVLEILGEWAAEIRLRNEIMRNHHGVVIEKGVVVLGYSPERFIASRVRISTGTILSFGDNCTGYSSVSIGEGSWIGQYNNFRASEAASIKLGANCLISEFCTLAAANHRVSKNMPVMKQEQDAQKRGIMLGDDVWLGAGCAVMAGVKIGSGCVIGANSVVTNSVPDYEIWAGVPARKIGERS